MNLENVWNKLEGCYETNDDKIMDVFNTIVFSRFVKFGEIEDFIERVERKHLLLAKDELSWIPSMEVGEEDSTPEVSERYYLHGNSFRELYMLQELTGTIWHQAKPKKKRFI